MRIKPPKEAELNPTQDNLVKMLQVLALSNKRISSHKWKHVLKVHAQIEQDKAQVISQEWLNYKKHFTQQTELLDLKKINNWLTYDYDRWTSNHLSPCINLTFEYVNEPLPAIRCNAEISDGSMVNGQAKEKRFKAVIILPLSFANEIYKEIQSRFETFLDEEYEVHLEKQARDWKRKYAKELLEI